LAGALRHRLRCRQKAIGRTNFHLTQRLIFVVTQLRGLRRDHVAREALGLLRIRRVHLDGRLEGPSLLAVLAPGPARGAVLACREDDMECRRGVGLQDGPVFGQKLDDAFSARFDGSEIRQWLQCVIVATLGFVALADLDALGGQLLRIARVALALVEDAAHEVEMDLPAVRAEPDGAVVDDGELCQKEGAIAGRGVVHRMKDDGNIGPTCGCGDAFGGFECAFFRRRRTLDAHIL